MSFKLSTILQNTANSLQLRWSGYLKAIILSTILSTVLSAICAILLVNIANILSDGLVTKLFRIYNLDDPLVQTVFYNTKELYLKQLISYFLPPITAKKFIFHIILPVGVIVICAITTAFFTCSILCVAKHNNNAVKSSTIIKYMLRNILKMTLTYIIYYSLILLPIILLFINQWYTEGWFVKKEWKPTNMGVYRTYAQILSWITFVIFSFSAPHILLNRFGIIRAIVESCKMVKNNIKNVIILVISVYVILYMLSQMLEKNLTNVDTDLIMAIITMIFYVCVMLFEKVALINIFLHSSNYVDQKVEYPQIPPQIIKNN